MDPTINESSNDESPSVGRMRADVKAQWVAALRSGESNAREAGASSANGDAVVYQQGKHVLHNVDENTYCCLGVLCDLAVRAGVITDDETVYNSAISGPATKFGNPDENAPADGVTVLPREVMDWAGLDEENPWDEDGDHQLAELNDDHGYSFEDLAHVIERDL